jgi:ubiquinone/menaquinone biosynthesis C-methylase UbiE
MGDISGKLLLDLGCGAGENSVYFAKKGARCIAADYSPGMVEVALQLAAANNVQIQGRTMNAIALDCPDNTFDFVYACQFATPFTRSSRRHQGNAPCS